MLYITSCTWLVPPGVSSIHRGESTPGGRYLPTRQFKRYANRSLLRSLCLQARNTTRQELPNEAQKTELVYMHLDPCIRATAPPRLMVPVSNSGLEPAVRKLESGRARRRPGPVLSINLVRHTFKGKVSEISPHTYAQCRRTIYKEQWHIDVPSPALVACISSAQGASHLYICNLRVSLIHIYICYNSA